MAYQMDMCCQEEAIQVPKDFRKLCRQTVNTRARSTAHVHTGRFRVLRASLGQQESSARRVGPRQGVLRRTQCLGSKSTQGAEATAFTNASATDQQLPSCEGPAICYAYNRLRLNSMDNPKRASSEGGDTGDYGAYRKPSKGALRC